MDDIFIQHRNSLMKTGEIYFWTATINKWQCLLMDDGYKEIIIGSLEHLSNKGKIDVFAFVIMPNHIHFIWRINEPNGKESPKGSFLKYTAHEFKRTLCKNNPSALSNYIISAPNKVYEFWQRDPLAVHLFTREVALQKLDYIHNNPLGDRWNLVKYPCDYKYSSARYYELNLKEFGFLKDLMQEI